ncbi:MAG: Shikimate 5-dehydrogenase I alpha, partial [uncultured Microvirga sp.]
APGRARFCALVRRDPAGDPRVAGAGRDRPRDEPPV